MRRLRDPRWQGENFAKNRAALSQLEALAAAEDIALSQLALAWLLAQGDDIVPIPGTRNAKRLEENTAAADVTLTADNLRRIREAFPRRRLRVPLRRGVAARLGVSQADPACSAGCQDGIFSPPTAAGR